MVNKEEFIKRLEKILDYYDLSASAFADRIGVQRSSISHLLSGRNNPSLDFVMRILQNFPEIELYWLLNGKGSFPPVDEETPTPAANLFTEEKLAHKSAEDSPAVTSVKEKMEDKSQNNEISRIVIFYKNGTFEEFKNT
ncbi:helix-turn-helix transcriptional regulator [Galbibacter sp. EGI 63066]|uniref:helix-turn-helix domain-containing protein n=1 Tax=Galbibacter sp. EGI 63066 TaxID=2993559 RepID=UPI00224884BB|nr:helix-turn-helix transcriptional regulator [Galbibacter sp. EGI 63066]MCX2680171.1 helix-turn-helix transcriptional regulator [Galbibacter sp. EGI 63066]